MTNDGQCISFSLGPVIITSQPPPWITDIQPSFHRHTCQNALRLPLGQHMHVYWRLCFLFHRLSIIHAKPTCWLIHSSRLKDSFFHGFWWPPLFVNRITLKAWIECFIMCNTKRKVDTKSRISSDFQMHLEVLWCSLSMDSGTHGQILKSMMLSLMSPA